MKSILPRGLNSNFEFDCGYVLTDHKWSLYYNITYYNTSLYLKI